MTFVSSVFFMASALAATVDDLFSTSTCEGFAFDAHYFVHSCIVINGHWRPVVCSQCSMSHIFCGMRTLSEALVFVKGCGLLCNVINFAPLNSRICSQFLSGKA